jgi:hypothetical protein
VQQTVQTSVLSAEQRWDNGIVATVVENVTEENMYELIRCSLGYTVNNTYKNTKLLALGELGLINL